MRRWSCTWVALALGAGCAPPLDRSPIGEVAVQIFTAFDEDPGSLPDLVSVVDQELDRTDLEARRAKRLFDLPELGLADLGGADVPKDIATESQFRAGLVGLSSYPLDDNLLAQVQVNMTCTNSRAVKCHQRVPVEGSDPAAFLAAEDDVYRTENTLRIETTASDFWIHVPVDFRWVLLEDGRRAVVGRTWAPRGFDNDGGKLTWDQRFGVDLFVEDPQDPGITRRVYATWLGPRVKGVVGKVLESSVRRGLEDGFSEPDKWLESGEPCDVDLAECLEESPF